MDTPIRKITLEDKLADKMVEVIQSNSQIATLRGVISLGVELKRPIHEVVLAIVLQDALKRNKGNQSKTARQLCISRGTLRKYMKIWKLNGK